MTTGTGLELILNAAEGALQMVVTEDETLLCAQEWRRPERATEILAPALRHICAALDLRLADFRRLACVRGPGSFTGIRLVLATAAALRRTGQVRLAGLDYLQALAATLETLLPRLDALWAAGDHKALLDCLGEVRPAVDAFFDGVMVMAEDADLRRNRLAMLRALGSRFARLADFAALQQ